MRRTGWQRWGIVVFGILFWHCFPGYNFHELLLSFSLKLIVEMNALFKDSFLVCGKNEEQDKEIPKYLLLRKRLQSVN